jgi:hypothetical protein
VSSPELDVPDHLRVEPVTVDRLERQLARAPGSVVGVVAPADDLPPGASTRTHAEWRSLRPLDAVEELTGGVPDGAVLRRPGAPSGGLLLADPGAVAHRRSAAAAPDEDAGGEGRSPFPWRPVVLFLALDENPALDGLLDGLLDRLLDGLIDADVEPRLATPVASTADRRHRPCAPTEATVARLEPDVLVALDAAALARGPAWCTRRGTVVIDMTAPTPRADGSAIELVPWRIGSGSGRLRARVDPTVDPLLLAGLVNRLAAGPQPVAPGRAAPPPDAAAPDARPTGAPPTKGSRRVTAVGPADGNLLDVLAERLAAAGHRVDRHPAPPAAAAEDDVVLVAADAVGDAGAMLAVRAAAGRPTVAVVDGHDQVVPDGLVAVSTGAEIVDRLRQAGRPALLLPPLTLPSRRDHLRAAADLPVAPSADVIGWTMVGSHPTPGPDDTDVAAALNLLLDARPDLTVEIVGGETTVVPQVLRDRTAVTIGPDRPDPGEQARWRAHVVTASSRAAPAELVAEMLEAGHLGVPTVVSPATAHVVGGIADPRLVPAGDDDQRAAPEAWAHLIGRLLQGDDLDATADRQARSARARAAADALDGPEAGDLVVARLLGWLDRRSRR